MEATKLFKEAIDQLNSAVHHSWNRSRLAGKPCEGVRV